MKGEKIMKFDLQYKLSLNKLNPYATQTQVMD